MQETQGDHSNTRQAVYMAAFTELQKLQRELDFEKVASQRTQRQKRIRQQALLAGGVLLSSLMSAMAVQATTQMIKPAVHEGLSEPEALALHSLVDYVATRQAANDRWIEHALCTHFEVRTIKDLPAADYDAAVFYLLKLAER